MCYQNAPLVDEFSKYLMTYIYKVLGIRVRHWISRKLHSARVVLDHRETQHTLPRQHESPHMYQNSNSFTASPRATYSASVVEKFAHF